MATEVSKVRNEWWTLSLGSDHSLEETQGSIVQGPDYSQAIMESNGVFTTISRGEIRYHSFPYFLIIPA